MNSKTPIRNTDSFVEATIQGVRNRIWAEDFKPSSGITFNQYIFNRIRNERKKLLREKRLNNTNERMASYLNDAMHMKFGPMEEPCTIMGIKKSHTSPDHPQGNAGPERFNRTLLNMFGTLEDIRKETGSSM